jgi:hypothetical protein
MEEGPDKDWLVNFRHKYKLRNKWVTLFYAEEIQVPGSAPCTVVRRLEGWEDCCFEGTSL